METTDGKLAPPAVTALRGAGAAAMERTLSGDMRMERQDLREAAEQTLNVILDLALDGLVRWVSPSWTDVIGTSVEEVQGRKIGEVVEAGEEVFGKAVEGMRGDTMRSQIVRFELELGEHSKLLRVREEGEEGEGEEADEARQTVDLEGQGIMVYDRATGEESHVSLDAQFGGLEANSTDYVDDQAMGRTARTQNRPTEYNRRESGIRGRGARELSQHAR